MFPKHRMVKYLCFHKAGTCEYILAKDPLVFQFRMYICRGCRNDSLKNYDPNLQIHDTLWWTNIAMENGYL